nr:hypothetical protein KitaXyl93_10110 [Kitasatospora sp. Xyl93]
MRAISTCPTVVPGFAIGARSPRRVSGNAFQASPRTAAAAPAALVGSGRAGGLAGDLAGY